MKVLSGYLFLVVNLKRCFDFLWKVALLLCKAKNISPLVNVVAPDVGLYDESSHLKVNFGGYIVCVFEEKYFNSPKPKLSSSTIVGFLIINPSLVSPKGCEVSW